MFDKEKMPVEKHGLLKSVFFAYFILLLHVALLCGLLFLVVFFRGVIQYMPWIFLAGSALVGVSGYRFYLHMKQEGKTLADTLRDPLFDGRSVEVSVLGGLAQFRLGKPASTRALPGLDPKAKRLEDSRSACIRELTELAMLFEKDLISEQEFARAKKKILDSPPPVQLL